MKRILITCVSIIIILVLLGGCGKKQEPIQTDIPIVVLTKGLSENELFRIDNLGCSVSEYMVYLVNIQNEYEEIYGNGIWDKEIDGRRLKDEIKDIALARISQIKAMKLMAESRGVTLNEDEIQTANDLGMKYFETLNTNEVETLNITVDGICEMCQDYMLAEKLYETIIVDVDFEISDDEAREVTVQQIMIPTATVDEKGERHSYSADEREAAKKKIEEAQKMLKGDETFDYVASIYSETKEITQAYDRKSAGEELEETIFNLAKDEISDVVETKDGYYIFHCIDTNNETNTEANKVKILDERRSETFTRQYKGFVEKLIVNLNKKLWENVNIVDDDSVVTNQFFTILGEQSFEIENEVTDGEE